MPRYTALVVLFGGLFTADAALGNGRFPTGADVHFRPGATELVLNPATVGLLISTDGGGTFRWVCEDAIGYTGTYDPDYAVGADGSIYATTFDGLKISTDGGCTFGPVQGTLGSRVVSDVEVGSDGRVWAVTEEGGVENDIFASDDGITFVSQGQVIGRGWYVDIRVSPSDPRRIYATHFVPPEPAGDAGPGSRATSVLVRSDDGGASWVQTSTDDITLGPAGRLLLGGVLAGSPEVVFAVAEGAGASGGGDLIYRSTDRGESWTLALETPHTLRGFVARADGNTVIAASRNYCPKDPQEPLLGDVQISADRGVTWQPTASQPLLCCIGERSDGTLFGCGENWEPDFFALGSSADGASWTKVMRFVELVGPLECPAGTIQRECTEDPDGWPRVCDDLGICDDADAGPAQPKPPDGCCDAGGGGPAGLGLLLIFVVLRRRL